jgi:hypothetical protein
MRARWLLGIIVMVVPARAALAYQECIDRAHMGGTNHWPNPLNVSNFGTQKWSFDWKVTSVEGLEISNVMYTSDLSQPRKLVMRRGSLPFLPVHYPDSAPMCGGSPHGFNDRLGFTDPICCAHVPTTPCNAPDRPQACMPTSQTITSCPGAAALCDGVCEGTQVDVSAPVEDGVGETVSGAANADVVLTAVFRLGGYQFVQRWRFQDTGTLLPSLRAGGVHNCQWHNHQIYWRFNFDLVGNGQSETVEQCASGTCLDIGSSGWLSAAGCGVAPSSTTSWRISDPGAGGRSVIVSKTAGDGNANTFCENTATECPTGCFNTRDFCALTAVEPLETFVSNNCNDSLQAAGSGGADKAFWYMGHVDHHDPCSFLPMCDPALGDRAFGPTVRLVGAW